MGSVAMDSHDRGGLQMWRRCFGKRNHQPDAMFCSEQQGYREQIES
jgi:hypothetical protein